LRLLWAACFGYVVALWLLVMMDEEGVENVWNQICDEKKPSNFMELWLVLFASFDILLPVPPTHQTPVYLTMRVLVNCC
jgi:hypothetical protein